MFGFGPMSSFYDEDFENNPNGYNPIEPFSQDEFIVHNDRELRNLDAGRGEWDDGDDDDGDYDDLDCPRCGHAVRAHVHAQFARCRRCGNQF